MTSSKVNGAQTKRGLGSPVPFILGVYLPARSQYSVIDVITHFVVLPP
ncbi:MAG: hypothetical protein H9847_03950 [Candidatus Anaerobiospirillum pullicola]|uniref:Uncharacterized protein n=1 Tax=Candidatus Anaerobiospirillum pullicola TaxID=2838451 RepID=A0A948TFP9_9GAMM|nr:hypothetical protein [Candidatus Anaerobiospirillum pullicola]